MKRSFEELIKYIKLNSSERFDELSEEMKKGKRELIKWFIIMSALAFGFFVYLNSMNTSSKVIPVSIGCLLLFEPFLFFILSVVFSSGKSEYVSEFKRMVISQLLRNFYDDVKYVPDGVLPELFYKEAKYNEDYNIYNSDDYMEAKIDEKYDMKMGEVHTIRLESHTDSNGHKTTTHTTVFLGLFAKIQMEKSINSNLLIMENHSFSGKDKLDMDSQEFEKIFDVSASNQIIGMQLLTHDIMELLTSFKNNTGITYDIAIYNNILYLRFHTGSMFEFLSFKKDAFDEKMLKKYYDVLDFTYTLSKMLIDLVENTEV